LRRLLRRLLLLFGRLLRVGALVSSGLFGCFHGLLGNVGGVAVPASGALAEADLLLANVPAFEAHVGALAVPIALVDVAVAAGDITVVACAAARLMAEVLSKVLVTTEELFVDDDLGLKVANLFDEDALGVLQDNSEFLLDDANVDRVADNSLLNDDLLVETADEIAMSVEIVKVARLLSSAIVIEAHAVTEGGHRRLSGKVDV